MFGLIGAYLLGRSDGRRAARPRQHSNYTVSDVKTMRGVALLFIFLFLVLLIFML